MQNGIIPFILDLGFRIKYGIFYISNQHFTDTGRGNRVGPCGMGRDQPPGRLWKRQPWGKCSCVVK